MGVMGQRLKTEKYFFLENGWIDFDEKNICYGFQYNVVKKLLNVFAKKYW